MSPDAPLPATAEDRLALRARARAVCRQVRLSLGRRVWRGAIGNWAGAGSGSSIDFQDHRPYLPGDDPRHIDWAAYARSGQVIMKLYREEVSPRVDILVDVSPSMFFEPAKARRTLELLYFCVESALALGSAPHVHALDGSRAEPIGLPALLAGTWAPPSAARGEHPPTPARAPLRPGSLRVWISDLLFPGAPEGWLTPLAAARGRVLALVPFAAAEEDPDWSDNVELEDCETGTRRRQRVDAALRDRYRRAYRAHLAAWREQARRRQAILARVPAAGGLAEALRTEALPAGAVEAWA
jgi:uncharacterized protein (DUF58 family)